MGKLPQVSFTITDGNLGRTSLTNDEISGIVFFNDNVADLTGMTASDNVVKFTNLGAVESAGITETSTNFKAEWYIISEYFRMGGGDIWIGIFDVPAGSYDYAELTTMKNISKGEIKQYSVVANQLTFAVAEINKINTVIETFWTVKKPAICLAIFDYSSETTLTAMDDLRALASDAPRVSVVFGTDTENMPDTLSGTTALANIGATLGAISSAKVSTNILEVGKYNYTDGVNMLTPGFQISGSTLIPITDYDETDLDDLNDKGYIFWRFFANNEGTYLSNDHNCTDITSDYSSIHNNRVIGKAIRQVDESVTPLIGSPVALKDGLLTPASVNRFKSAASAPLNIMESDDEISSYSIFIDRDQNVASTNTVYIQISIVPIFTADNITIEIGFSRT